MSVEIDEHGTVTANGRPVDYATAYAWCVDSPETITELVQDTKAFATVIAAAEHAGPEEQAEAVRQAFVAGVPREPGASWTDAVPPEPATGEPAADEPTAGESTTDESTTDEPTTDAPSADAPSTGEFGPTGGDPVPTSSGPES
ncbi:hypothetical protein AVL61_00385 [Kocuria rosea subsp. polaris]|uniref:Uncharacterized protein n=1 Tax=Kocuria rosea subsp. polaris TaxID=136273 RepID=A0A0W8IME1_KOCRO|nr:hypothetical protein [Kocuria polaris]KUG61426.1 hypothetical protein AVL61_00385 [Kocuria polaris]